MDYKELYKLWLKEKGSKELLELPADFYISMDGKFSKLYRDSQDHEWKELANIVISRMEYLMSDLTQIRLTKIMNLITNNENIDDNVITWGERRLIKNLRQSIQMLSIEKPNILDTQDKLPDTDLTNNSEADLIQIDEKNDSMPKSAKNLLVRMLTDVEAFVALDNIQWGPFMAYDIACLPTENAKALIARGAARIIETEKSIHNENVSGEKE